MLPEDAKQRREATLDTSQQTSLSEHFDPREADVVPYSDRVFEATAIEWLIQSNQVSYSPTKLRTVLIFA
jgi:hypothetical protein